MEPAENQGRSNSRTSLSKIETLKLLNDSIDRLEQSIKEIQDDSATIPSSESIDTLLTTTQKIADVTNPPVAKETKATVVSPPAIAPAITTPSAPKVPQQSPPQSPVKTNVQKKRNLTWIIVAVTAIAVAIVTVFWLWLPSQPEIVSAPLEPTVSDVSSDISPNIAPTSEGTLPREPSVTTATDLEVDTDLEEPVATPEVLIPSELEAPGRFKNLKLVEIAPKLDFSPEQTLIANLEGKIADLTQDYPADLIQSVEVDLPENSLLVKVTDNWYELTPSRQTQLANKILQRSRNFSFERLHLEDNSGTLVARNPVIGEEIIVVQQEKAE